MQAPADASRRGAAGCHPGQAPPAPRLLILDEATTGLDLLVEADILGTIRRLKEQSDMSILMITHDRRLSDAFCHRRIEIGGRK